MATRSFIVASESALAGDGFLLEDVPGTSGRMDVLARCIRAALLVSHGVRNDTRLYLVLGGGPHAPITVRLIGGLAKFVRPDERAGAVLLKKILAHAPTAGPELRDLRYGVSLGRGGVELATRDIGDARRFVLVEGAPDLRSVPNWDGDTAFLLGDHKGLAPASRAAFGDATEVSIGPISVHTEDAITLTANELDRRT